MISLVMLPVLIVFLGLLFCLPAPMRLVGVGVLIVMFMLYTKTRHSAVMAPAVPPAAVAPAE